MSEWRPRPLRSLRREQPVVLVRRSFRRGRARRTCRGEDFVAGGREGREGAQDRHFLGRASAGAYSPRDADAPEARRGFCASGVYAQRASSIGRGASACDDCAGRSGRAKAGVLQRRAPQDRLIIGGVRKLLLGEPSTNTSYPLARTSAPPPTSLRFRTKACSAIRASASEP